ncbi:anti-sigma factor family protein [Derxia gummosa]|uniref:Anti-sigma factor family protein n=1 Tax=Derxia gummosa DSM 723 TaxID=1121388 RepID=A0A8B6X8L9_9BURK|nr:hypothetical protein [Derxia gummosa]
MNDSPVSRAELGAFVDGELELARTLEIEARLARDAGLRAEVEALRALRDGLRAEAERHAAPAALRARLAALVPDGAGKAGGAGKADGTGAATSAPAGSPAPGPRRKPAAAPGASAPAGWFAWRPWAGALAFSAVATVALQFALAGAGEARRLDEELVASHARATLAARVVDIASSDHHQVRPWLAARLDFAPPVIEQPLPDASFLGGRLDYVAGRPVAVLAYRLGAHQADLYVWPEPGPDHALARADARGYRIERWARDGMRRVLVSDLGADESARLAAGLGAR